MSTEGERKVCLAPTFSDPLVQGLAVEPDLDGGAVPGPRAGEGLRGRERRRERDGARGTQQAPGLQPRERGVHQRVPLRHCVERAARVGRRRNAHAERRRASSTRGCRKKNLVWFGLRAGARWGGRRRRAVWNSLCPVCDGRHQLGGSWPTPPTETTLLNGRPRQNIDMALNELPGPYIIAARSPYKKDMISGPNFENTNHQNH